LFKKSERANPSRAARYSVISFFINPTVSKAV
jgi:hypothetical protein